MEARVWGSMPRFLSSTHANYYPTGCPINAKTFLIHEHFHIKSNKVSNVLNKQGLSWAKLSNNFLLRSKQILYDNLDKKVFFVNKKFVKYFFLSKKFWSKDVFG